ncbi:ankyrin repeat-containing domain protein [Trichoderma austrokoningii]
MASLHRLAAASALNEDLPWYMLENPRYHITRLPVELKLYVIQDLSIGDLGRLAQVSFFKNLVTPIMYKRDNQGDNPRAIRWAASIDPASVRREDIMTVLDLAIMYGADVNRTYVATLALDRLYATALHLAAARGNLQVVKKLLNHGADPNALGRDFLYSPELLLDHEEFDEIMEEMSQTAVVVSARFSLWRPLFVPFVLGHEGIIQALLRKGASPILTIADPERMVSAPETSIINILHILASQRERGYTDPTGLSYFKRYSNLINMPVPGGETPLSTAMRHNNVDLIKDIIANGGDVEVVSEIGTTPLIQAIKCFNNERNFANRRKYMELIRSLVKDCNAGVGKHSDPRVSETPLTCAVMSLTNDFQCIAWKNAINEVQQIINLLLDHGADVNEKSSRGYTILGALCWVIFQRKQANNKQMNCDGFLKLFKELVNERGADVNVRLPSGSSILGACILKFRREPLSFFQTLLELNAKLTHEEINPIFMLWVKKSNLRNPKHPLNILEYSNDITQDSIDFAYRACLNGEDKLWDMLQSHFPHSTVPQEIAAEALVKDDNLKRFYNALRFKNFDGSYIDADGDSFLHLIVIRLERVVGYGASRAVADAKQVVKLGASVEATDKDGLTASHRLLLLRMKGNSANDPLRLFLYTMEHGKRFFGKMLEAKTISAEVYERKYKELIKLHGNASK